MAVKYCRSAAAGAGTGADWTNAYTTLAAALTGSAAGDTVYVADDHAETQGSAMTLTSPGTPASPVLILCVNTHTVTPPTALATSATVTTTGTFAINFNGFFYCYGITFTGASASTSSSYINFSAAAAPIGQVFEACKFATANTGAATSFFVGQSTSSSDDQYVKWINCTVKFAATGQQIKLGGARFYWINTVSAVDVAGSIPTVLLSLAPASQNTGELSALDLSALGSGKALVAIGTSSASGRLYIRNCKLGASVSITSGTIVGQGGSEVFVENCDSGSTNYRMEHYKYQGSIVQETTKVRSGGASDGTTPIAHKFVTLATGPTLFSPLEGPWISVWNDATGSSKTATVEILHDSATNLQDSEVWLEVEYLGTSGFPESVYANDRVADAFATAADQSASAVTWTTTGLASPNKQKLEVAFTPQIKGPIRARVCVAKANYTVYVDPVVTVS